MLLNWKNALWAIAYLCWLIFIIVYLLNLRAQQVQQLSSTKAQQDWETWREQAANDVDAPVRRRKPKSAEPPALVLLRDYFPVVMAAGLVFGTALFIMFAFALRGTFSRGTKPKDSFAGL